MCTKSQQNPIKTLGRVDEFLTNQWTDRQTDKRKAMIIDLWSSANGPINASQPILGLYVGLYLTQTKYTGPVCCANKNSGSQKC